MIILPLTTAQRAFVEVEIVGRYTDDEEHAAMVAVIADHLARRHGGGLAVARPADLAALMLDALNAIDDAIAIGRSEAEGYGTPRAARGLHRTGTAILGRVSSLARRSVEFVGRVP